MINFAKPKATMITASQKKKENIAEYLLYMWQIEDLIRANGLDIDRLERTVIEPYPGLTPEQRRDMRDWYESLIDMMRREGVTGKGHLQLNRNTLSELSDLHSRLLADPRFAEYSEEFYRTLPYIVELRAKSGGDAAGELETCFNALYGLMVLRLQKREVSEETLRATAQITRLLARLAKYYNLDRDGELFKQPD